MARRLLGTRITAVAALASLCALAPVARAQDAGAQDATTQDASATTTTPSSPAPVTTTPVFVPAPSPTTAAPAPSTAPSTAPGTAPTLATSPRPRVDPVRTLNYNLRIDLPVTFVAAAAWIGTELAKPWLAPSMCVWCERHPSGADAVNGADVAVRTALRWSDTNTPNDLSNVAAFGILPVATLGINALIAWRDDRVRYVPIDALIVAEATMLAIDLNQLIKFVAGRERPLLHYANDAERASLGHSADHNLSFYSGHATFTFALAVASGTVATMRGYRLAGLVWGVGLPLAVLSSYLRIAADRHYFTDVLLGTLLGSGVGFLVPFLFHRPDYTPARGGASAARTRPFALAPMAVPAGMGMMALGTF